LLGAACIGLSPIFVRLSELGPIAIAFYRVFLAIPLVLLALRLPGARRAGPLLNKRKTAIGVVLASVFFTGDLILWHTSIVHTNVANATLFANMAVVYVSLGAWLLFGQALTRVFMLGMIIALAGAAMLSADSFSLGWGGLFGDLLAMGAAVCYAGYLLMISWARGRMGTRRLILLTCIGCSLLLMPLMLVFEDDWLPATLYAFALLLGLAWVSHAFGQGLIAYGMGYLPASLSAVSLLVQPVVAGGLAWLLFNEALSALQIAGACAVVIGLVVCRGSSD